MNDTTIFIKGKPVTLTRAMKAGLIYVALDVVLSSLSGLGQTLFELKQSDWDSYWTAQKAGWIMLQAGAILSSAFLTLKAFLSNSSKPDAPAAPPQPQPITPTNP